jgi:hypothetical protein
MSLFTASGQAEQLSLADVALSSETIDDINSTAKIKNLRLNLFNSVIAKLLSVEGSSRKSKLLRILKFDFALKHAFSVKTGVGRIQLVKLASGVIYKKLNIKSIV